MRKVIILLVVLSLCGTLWAADPIIGTWRLNIAKSRLPPNQASILENLFVIRELGDDFELVAKGIQKDGSPVFTKYTWPKNGGFRNFKEGGPAEGILFLEIVIDDIEGYTKGNGYTTILLNGRQIAVTQWILSKDGRTWRGIGKASSTEGKSYEGLQWYEKE